MKKIKTLSITTLTLSFLLAMTSCGKQNQPSETTTVVPSSTVPTTPEPVEWRDIPYYPNLVVSSVGKLDYKERFSSITIDTTKAKLSYYMGEVFDPTGIEVTNNFIIEYDDNRENSSTSRAAKNVSYILDEVDMNTAGTYRVIVQSRDNATVRERSFNIVVQSSELAASGEAYVGGLKVTYDGKSQEDLLLKTPFTFDKTKVSVSAVWYKDGKPTEEKALTADELTIDATLVKTDKVGTYMIKYTYTGPTVTFMGKEYKNIITTYTLINIINPITKIEYEDGTYGLEASSSGLDFSDWKIRVFRESYTGEDKGKVVKYSPELFSIENVSPFTKGQQTISVVSKEDPTKSFNFKITVKESTKENIVIANSILYVDADGNTSGTATEASIKKTIEGFGEVYQMGTSGLVYGRIEKADASKSASKDNISFTGRPTIKGSSQEMIVQMPAAGTIVFYCSPTSDEEREVQAYAPNGEIIESYTTNPSVANLTAIRIEASQAGNYYFRAPKGVYAWGFIIATTKEAA